MHVQETLLMKHPIIQAPMAGVTTPEMVVASCKAGILGSIAAGYLSVEETSSFIRTVKKQTKNPFMVNLFVYESPPLVEHQIIIAKQALIDAKVDDFVKRDELNLSMPNLQEQIDVVIEENVAICSFTFGIPTNGQIRQLKEHGILIMLTATSLDEVKIIEQLDVDVICLQGKEAGGHRGSFLEPLQFIALDELFSLAKEVATKPIVVAGGIATGEQVNTYLNAGASAVVLGTLFLATSESGASSAYKEAVLKAEKNSTVMTKSFSGKPARGIENDFIRKMLMMPIAPFPYQNDLTKGIRSRAIQTNNANNISLWAGTSLHLTRSGTMKEVIENLVASLNLE